MRALLSLLHSAFTHPETATAAHAYEGDATLDILSYPHILEAVISDATCETLLALRATCTEAQLAVDKDLNRRASHMVALARSKDDPKFDTEINPPLLWRHANPLCDARGHKCPLAANYLSTMDRSRLANIEVLDVEVNWGEPFTSFIDRWTAQKPAGTLRVLLERPSPPLDSLGIYLFPARPSKTTTGTYIILPNGIRSITPPGPTKIVIHTPISYLLDGSSFFMGAMMSPTALEAVLVLPTDVRAHTSQAVCIRKSISGVLALMAMKESRESIKLVGLDRLPRAMQDPILADLVRKERCTAFTMDEYRAHLGDDYQFRLETEV